MPYRVYQSRLPEVAIDPATREEIDRAVLSASRKLWLLVCPVRKYLRWERMTQRQLARRLKVTLQTMEKILRGEGDRRIETKLRLATALKIDDLKLEEEMKIWQSMRPD